MSSVDTATTSLAGMASSQLQLGNPVAANPLTSLLAGSALLNQYPSGGLPAFSPLLMQPTVNSVNLPGATASGLGAAPDNQNAPSYDPNLELANMLSSIVLSPALAQQTVLANMSAQFAANQQGLQSLLGGAGFGLAGQQAAMTQQGLLNAAIVQQGLLSAGGGNASLFSPSVQQQLLQSSSLMTPITQAAASTVRSAPMPANPAPVNSHHPGAGMPAGGGELGAAASQALFGVGAARPLYQSYSVGVPGRSSNQ